MSSSVTPYKHNEVLSAARLCSDKQNEGCEDRSGCNVRDIGERNKRK